MEPADKRRKIDAVELEIRIKRGSNFRLKSIIENPNNAFTQDDGLLHMAVKHKNLDLLDFLLTLGYDANVRDSSGSTSLMLAATDNNVGALHRLLDTDVCISDATGRSSYEILVGNGLVPKDVVQKCLERFSVSKVDPQTKTRILLATHCCVRLVVSLRDAAVTQAFLDHMTVFDNDESMDIMRAAMRDLDVENVRALLHHGPAKEQRKGFFWRFLIHATRGAHPNLTLFETFIRALVHLDILDNKNVYYLRPIAMDGREEAVRKLLQSSVFNSHACGKKCLGKLLLQYGADVQAVNEYDHMVFDDVAYYKPILSCILPQLAIVEAQGTPILQQIRERIDRKKLCNDAYALYCMQLDAFKKHKLARNVTLFTVLTEKIEVLVGLLRDEDKISLVEKYCYEKKVHPHYKSTLKLKLKRAMNFYRAKCNVDILVSKSCGRAVGSGHLVAEKIFSFLRYYDMIKLAAV